MRNPFRPGQVGKTVAVVLGVFLMAGGGCAGSRSSRFYTLIPLSAPGELSGTVSAERRIAVTVGPVTIPDYLDRPQILTRSGPGELKLAEFERWAGSLEEDISRVLAENLSALLPRDKATVFRWGGDASPFPAEYRVSVDVMQFEGSIGESVTLAARWSVRREEDRKLLSARQSNVREPVDGEDYDALVGAMSRALGTLSREITAAIPVQ